MGRDPSSGFGVDFLFSIFLPGPCFGSSCFALHFAFPKGEEGNMDMACRCAVDSPVNGRDPGGTSMTNWRD